MAEEDIQLHDMTPTDLLVYQRLLEIQAMYVGDTAEELIRQSNVGTLAANLEIYYDQKFGDDTNTPLSQKGELAMKKNRESVLATVGYLISELESHYQVNPDIPYNFPRGDLVSRVWSPGVFGFDDYTASSSDMPEFSTQNVSWALNGGEAVNTGWRQYIKDNEPDTVNPTKEAVKDSRLSLYHEDFATLDFTQQVNDIGIYVFLVDRILASTPGIEETHTPKYEMAELFK